MHPQNEKKYSKRRRNKPHTTQNNENAYNNSIERSHFVFCVTMPLFQSVLPSSIMLSTNTYK